MSGVVFGVPHSESVYSAHALRPLDPLNPFGSFCLHFWVLGCPRFWGPAQPARIHGPDKDGGDR